MLTPDHLIRVYSIIKNLVLWDRRRSRYAGVRDIWLCRRQYELNPKHEYLVGPFRALIVPDSLGPSSYSLFERKIGVAS